MNYLISDSVDRRPPRRAARCRGAGGIGVYVKSTALPGSPHPAALMMAAGAVKRSKGGLNDGTA